MQPHTDLVSFVRAAPRWAMPVFLTGLIAWLPAVALFALGGGDAVKSRVAAAGVALFVAGVLMIATATITAMVRWYNAVRSHD